MKTEAGLPGAVAPRTKRGGRRALAALLLLAVAIPAGLKARSAARSAREVPLAAVEVDRGDVPVVIVEGGALESANNATVKCKVEALIGLVGGAGKPGAGGGGSGGGASGGGSAGAASSPAPAASPAPAPTAATRVAGSGASQAAAPAAGGSSSASGGSSASAGGSPASAGGGGGGSGSDTSGSTPATPVIASFSYTVAPHVPLRPATAKASTQTKAAVQAAGGQGGGQGGGGQGGANGQAQQKPGSTRIISILPEGTEVQAGDVVCELDSSAFRDELQAQRIKFFQAKSWVEQARSIFGVNEIALREYRDGIHPQDRSQLDSYIAACRLEQRKSADQAAWSREIARKHLRTASQLRGDELALQKAEISLREAIGMRERLEKFTAPKLLKSLEAKREAIRADLLAQEAALGLETDRLHRLEKMVEYCTMRAPRDGIVVYVNQANRWGRVDNPIQEGITVREGMPIFNLPDPRRMCVRAKINESKVNTLHHGQEAEIRIDAFPGRPLRGSIADVTPIPAPNGGPISDVKVYDAIVNIDGGGFEGLRPGLSAQVRFDGGTARDVVRVPLRAIRWVDADPFAAILTADGPKWSRLKLGSSNASYAEVRSGLKPGDRVAAEPEALAPPDPASMTPPAVAANGPGRVAS